MCGCYELKAKARALNRRFPLLRLAQADMPGSSDMHPTDPVLMITSTGSGHLGCTARWGLVGSFLDHPPQRPLITLPGEGLSSRPFYSKVLKRNRCLIPATAFHAWQRLANGMQKIRISGLSGELLMFAGIFDHHPLAGTTCAILTSGANAAVGAIQERMPILLEQKVCNFWLGEHADFPDAEFEAVLNAPSQYRLKIEPVIEEAPSPQLALAFT